MDHQVIAYLATCDKKRVCEIMSMLGIGVLFILEQTWNVVKCIRFLKKKNINFNIIIMSCRAYRQWWPCFSTYYSIWHKL